MQVQPKRVYEIKLTGEQLVTAATANVNVWVCITGYVI